MKLGKIAKALLRRNKAPTEPIHPHTFKIATLNPPFTATR